ncbi:hypothetical protein MPTK1_8g18250 [Marchantia polymorpha subsp. ruderalis]|uniref:14-3-3 domain-containing protein n=1 Tax=Marchantia polymorpha TaxID=3197 RepID=A0A2R6X8M5_MARPO|nr:hypothetical protein MARPO_0030s0157 [Marchantia polymorpha]BBN20327.1 hypothetical protein Mp_8g18250 [Marchantia polymorpha subsp. ruderalis]|eukprot:PTQ42447.1 hypothetical protein MARPO_0030s0157 [Marchantia polymorpha]
MLKRSEFFLERILPKPLLSSQSAKDSALRRLGVQRSRDVFAAELADKLSRHDDMVAAMKAVAESSFLRDLSAEERNLLYKAYKNQISSRRKQWRILREIEREETSKGNQMHLAAVRKLIAKVESEIRDICETFIGLIDDHVLRAAGIGEPQVFCWRAKADFQRYLAELSSSHKHKIVAEFSYKRAQELASKHLSPLNPQRLHLAVNFFIFYLEVKNSPEKALTVAQEALDLAESEFMRISRTGKKLKMKESETLMRHLREEIELLQQSEEDVESDEGAENTVGVGSGRFADIKDPGRSYVCGAGSSRWACTKDPGYNVGEGSSDSMVVEHEKSSEQAQEN